MQSQALPSSDCHSGFVSSNVGGSLSCFQQGATTWPLLSHLGFVKRASYSAGDAGHRRVIHSFRLHLRGLEMCRACGQNLGPDSEQGHRGPVPTVCKADGGVDRQNRERGGLGQGWRGNQGRNNLRGNTQRGLERVCPWSKEGLVQSVHLQSSNGFVPGVGSGVRWRA